MCWKKYTRRAKELESERKVWLRGVPKKLRTMMRNVHGPLIQEIVNGMNFEDTTFCECVQQGFPVAGEMCDSIVGDG